SDAVVSTIDFDSANFSYYPNPVKTSITIDATNNVEEIEVFNMLGQRVITQRPNQTNPRLEMGNLEAGVYLMKVSINGASKTFQVIKE
ncbi:T9SS type A sorting domain-containing protein, partial [Psychroflexus salis]|uniref:T9SS type A sorting domain-containing protein n=1 Tax=Psychroflexus salis TaxID=1526574 RepID=UPI0016681313